MVATSPGYVSSYANLPSTTNVSSDEGLIILNSAPKAGRYIDSHGKEFGYGITRVTLINVSESPCRITIDFPADSFAFISSLGSYVKLFLPPDKIAFSDMRFDNSSWYYNDSLKAFLDADHHTPTTSRATIGAKQERVFYIGALYYKTAGVPRAELFLKNQHLFFRPGRLDSLLIPCGKAEIARK